MNKKILNMINTTAGQLVFALLSGLGYFMLVFGWIMDFSRGMWLMPLYLAPIIICGAALIIIKLIKASREAENEKNIMRIFWLHTAVIILGIVFFAVRFI